MPKGNVRQYAEKKDIQGDYVKLVRSFSFI